MDDLFDGGRDEDVAFLVKHVLSLIGLGAGESDDSTILYSVVFQSLKLVYRNGLLYLLLVAQSN